MELPNLIDFRLNLSEENPTLPSPRQWSEIFPNPQPVKVEIGPGKGEFLLEMAKKEPSSNFLGIEIRFRRAQKIAGAITRSNLHNVKIIAADAKVALNTVFLPNSIQSFFIHFPDPWPKRSHERRRLLENDLFVTIHRLLIPEGLIFLTTDVAYYATLIQEMLGQNTDFTQIYHHTGEGTTEYHNTLHAAKFKAAGRKIAYFCFAKKKSSA